MRIVLDASVAIAWVASDESSASADDLHEKVLLQGAVVPGLWFVEVANVLLKKVRKKQMPLDDATLGLARLCDMRIVRDTEPEQETTSRTFELAHRHRLTAYDAAYLELAVRRNLPLATLDAELRAAALAESVELLA